MLVASVGLGISLLKVEVLWLVGVQNCRAGCWASVITHGDGASMHGIAELYDPGVLSEELFKLIEAMRFGLLSQSPLHTAWGLKAQNLEPLEVFVDAGCSYTYDAEMDANQRDGQWAWKDKTSLASTCQDSPKFKRLAEQVLTDMGRSVGGGEAQVSWNKSLLVSSFRSCGHARWTETN